MTLIPKISIMFILWGTASFAAISPASKEVKDPCNSPALIHFFESLISEQIEIAPELRDTPRLTSNQVREAIDLYHRGEHKHLIETVFILNYWKIILNRRFRSKIGYRSLDTEELFSVASVAILLALEKFDPEEISAYTGQRVNFFTYIYKTIATRLDEALGHSAGLSTNAYRNITKIRWAHAHLTATLLRVPTDSELASFLKWPEAKAKLYRNASEKSMGAQGRLGESGMDSVPARREDFDTNSDFLTFMERLKKGLKPNMFFVIQARVMEERSFTSIGSELGVSNERARQIYSAALEKARSILERNSFVASQ